MHTDKLKLFFGEPSTTPRSWLNEIDRSSDSLEMGTILDPESPCCDRNPVRPISDELCPALQADNRLPAAKSLSEDGQSRVQDGRGARLRRLVSARLEQVACVGLLAI